MLFPPSPRPVVLRTVRRRIRPFPVHQTVFEIALVHPAVRPLVRSSPARLAVVEFAHVFVPVRPRISSVSHRRVIVPRPAIDITVVQFNSRLPREWVRSLAVVEFSLFLRELALDGAKRGFHLSRVRS